MSTLAVVPAATTVTHGLKLAWTESTTGTTFNVYRGIAAGAESATPLVTGLTTTTYLDTNGTAGTVYFYYVTAVLAGIESAPSNEASATFPTVPSSPTSLTCVAV